MSTRAAILVTVNGMRKVTETPVGHGFGVGVVVFDEDKLVVSPAVVAIVTMYIFCLLLSPQDCVEFASQGISLISESVLKVLPPKESVDHTIDSPPQESCLWIRISQLHQHP